MGFSSESMTLEFFGTVSIYFGLGVQILTAVVLGGLVGLDREKKNKAAGIKTNILICIGATIYTSVSLMLQKSAGGVADPNRIAAQIVSGIGFLGAGSIIQGRGSVKGLTTAATIWVVASIGVTIGAGYPIIACIFTLTLLGVLILLGPLYSLFEIEKNYHVEILSKGTIKHSILAAAGDPELINDYHEEVLDEKKNLRIFHIHLTMAPFALRSFISEIKDVIQVEKVHFMESDSSVINTNKFFATKDDDDDNNKA